MFRKTITLGLDYTEFTGGTQEINRKLRLLDDEFKLASEQAKGFGDESNQLTLKQEALRQKIILQEKAVEEAKKIYEKAIKTSKEGSKQMDYADSQLLKARTALEKTKNELAEVDKEISSADENSSTFGDTIRDLAATIGIDTNPAVEKLASKLDGFSESAGTAALVAGTIIGVLAKLAVSAAGTADELLTLSSVTGISTENLQKLNYASDLVDVSVDTMQGSMSKMIKTMDSARKGTDETQEAYRKLHVRITDGTGALRNSEEVFYDVIDALGKVKNETERDALAMTIFGRSAQELNPLIESGSDALKALGEEAENVGAILSQEELDKLGRLQNSMDRMKQAGEGLKNNLGLILAPALTSLFEALNGLSPEQLSGIVNIITAITTAFLAFKIIMTIVEAVDKFDKFFKATEKGFDMIYVKIVAVVLVIAALIALIAVLAGKTSDIERVGKSMGDMASSITESTAKAQKVTGGTQYHASGTRSFSGGRTWVGEAGPEIVELPEGSRIYSNQESRRMSGGDNYYFNLQTSSIREFNNLVTMAKNRRRIERME